jgi:uncharacterized membrane protein/protein-disulfide isomerase
MWVSFTSSSVIGCGPGADCEKILSSRWSNWLGIPVSLFAAAVYLGIFATGALVRREQVTPRGENALAWMTVLVLMAAGGAVWFIGLQIFALEDFCLYCMLVHMCGLFSSVALFRFTSQDHSISNHSIKGQRTFSARKVFSQKRIGIGLGSVGILVAGQVFYQQPTFMIQSLQNTHRSARSKGTGFVDLHQGKFRLNLAQLPLMGSYEAKHAIVSLFDYTCRHCREAHHYLQELQMRFGKRLAVVSLPLPLDSYCNFLVKETPSEHVNACKYARFGLAVWLANPKKFREFDDWLFQPQSPPSVAEARLCAEQLVGRDAFIMALENEWITQQIQRNVNIFKENYLRVKTAQMPQIIIGSKILVGALNRIESIYELLETEFGLMLSSQNVSSVTGK